MPKTTVTVITCDSCHEEVTDDKHTFYVDAIAYGRVYHEACWEQMNGPIVARALGLDDIRIRYIDSDMEITCGGRYGVRQ